MTSAEVGRLSHYPVKSMLGEEVDEIVLTNGGVVGDRGYGFLDTQTGNLISAKRPKRSCERSVKSRDVVYEVVV